ncbi:MAG: helix-turn-helix domain-containing protein [Lachnospiraceae bacterium]|nr:helix-turn-helix domain-containing protein [Lachnospiraceae bacterium]
MVRTFGCCRFNYNRILQLGRVL